MFSGLLESGFLYVKYDEVAHEGARLGRNMWLDGRSLAHMVENDVQEMGKSLASQEWERALAVLDQGQLGSCTGNAGTGALGTQPFYNAVGRSVLPAANDAAAAEEFAVQLYSDATVADGYPGTYPPEDTGSSGLAICKVLKTRGAITGYRHARTAYGFQRLLQTGPVLQGMPWYNAFFEPDAQGFIDSDQHWSSSGVRRRSRGRGSRRGTRHHRCVQQRDHIREQLGHGLGRLRSIPDTAAHLRTTKDSHNI